MPDKKNKSSLPSYIQNVHDITCLIPEGRVSTYGAIADYLALGSARMVGWALNKASLVDQEIPAHRVVNRKGELSGRNNFPTPATMQKRLQVEGVEVIDHKVAQFQDLFWHPENLEKE